MKKRLVTLSLLLILVASLLVGCGETKESARTSGKNSKRESKHKVEESAENEAEDESDEDNGSETVVSDGNESTTDFDSFVAEDTKSEKDLCTVYYFGEGRTYTEFMLIYENADGMLTRIVDEVHYVKDDPDYNWDISYFEELNVDDIFNGFSSLSFAEKEVYDAGDFYVMRCCFNDLDVARNVHEMADRGIITVDFDNDEQLVSAQSYNDWMNQSGYRVLTAAECDSYGIGY